MTPSTVNSQSKRLNPHSLFLLHMQAQKKKLSKRKRRKKISRSAERDKGSAFTPSRRRRHTCFAYVSIPLLNSFCRLAATSANKVPRPSRYSIATATGSKRSSADSDSLLCHVGLWRTSRFRFGCASVCEHSKIRVCFGNPISALTLSTPAPLFFSGRADNACTNLLGFFV